MELAALSLPQKFADHSNIKIADCKAQVEKGLAKYRWSVRNSKAQKDKGKEEPKSYRTSVNVFETAQHCYGNITVFRKELAAFSLPQKFADYSNINKTSIPWTLCIKILSILIFTNLKCQ